MQTGPVRRISRQDIRPVQQLIERCLQLYMAKSDVEEFLFAVAHIEPQFTELIWKRLEVENIEFFHTYYLKLKLKQQIINFNNYLDQQAQLMCQNGEVLSTYDSYGPHIRSIVQNTAYHGLGNTGPTVKQQNMHHSLGSSLPNVVTDGSLSFNAGIPAAVKPPTHRIHLDVPQPAMVSTQSSAIGLTQGSNESTMKSEAGCSGISADKFGPESNAQDTRSATKAVPCITAMTSSQPPNEPTFLDADFSSCGVLPEIPPSDTCDPVDPCFDMVKNYLCGYQNTP